MLPNCSKAASRFSAISCARISGAGRFSESSRLSSLSQNISRLTLSRWIGAAGGDDFITFLFFPRPYQTALILFFRESAQPPAAVEASSPERYPDSDKRPPAMALDQGIDLSSKTCYFPIKSNSASYLRAICGFWHSILICFVLPTACNSSAMIALASLTISSIKGAAVSL